MVAGSAGHDRRKFNLGLETPDIGRSAPFVPETVAVGPENALGQHCHVLGRAQFQVSNLLAYLVTKLVRGLVWFLRRVALHRK